MCFFTSTEFPEIINTFGFLAVYIVASILKHDGEAKIHLRTWNYNMVSKERWNQTTVVSFLCRFSSSVSDLVEKYRLNESGFFPPQGILQGKSFA